MVPSDILAIILGGCALCANVSWYQIEGDLLKSRAPVTLLSTSHININSRCLGNVSMSEDIAK